MRQQQSETRKSSNVFLCIAVALMAFQLGVVVGMWAQRKWFTMDSLSWQNDERMHHYQRRRASIAGLGL